MNYKKLTPLFLIALLSSFISTAQVSFTASEMVGRISDSSVCIHAATVGNLDYYYEYGTVSGSLTERYPISGNLNSFANKPFETCINGLMPNTRYYYRLVYSLDGGSTWFFRDEYTFHTQRSTTSAFVFTISSDSHIKTDALAPVLSLYNIALENIRNDHPDFHFDLGDAFVMSGINPGDSSSVETEYLFQRNNFASFGHSAAIYLALGNHEDEEGWNLDDVANPADSKPVMSANARKKFFMNPVPDNFFSGNSDASQTAINGDHLRGDYYAFEWGDALFVVIDPYWYTITKPYPGTQGGEVDDEVNGNGWDWTLGDTQRAWFKQTLESSSAKWKFVFSHQVTGGTNLYGRGGAAAAGELEWGAGPIAIGNQRPTWPDSTNIHQIMVENGVTIFFHGHDHVYAREEIDGMIYQECPQPCDIEYDSGFGEYTNNDSTLVINNSGHLRVKVEPTYVQVDYVRAYLPEAGTNGTIAHTYYIGSSAGIEDIELEGYSLELFPNPASNNTNLKFTIPEKQKVQIRILNIMGVEILRPIDEVMNSGMHKVEINTEKMSAGQYFVKIESGKCCIVRKLVVL